MNQIQFESNGLTVLACRVPDTACDFIVNHRFFYYSMPDDTEPIDRFYNLPEGNWKLHAVTDSMTEEQAKVLVDKFIIGYEDYEHTNADAIWYYEDPIDSLKSLLRSQGIDPAEKWALLVCE